MNNLWVWAEIEASNDKKNLLLQKFMYFILID